MRKILLTLLLAMVFPCAAGADEIIKKGELLTLDRAIAIASERHPSIRAALGSVGAAGSRIGQAESAYYPQIDASGGYSRIKPTTLAEAASGSGTQLLEASSFDQYTASVALRQNIYDFGRTRAQVDIQKLNFEASNSDLTGIRDSVVFNVKQSFFSALKARRNRDVAEETVSQFLKHLEQAKGFFEVGTKPRFDVTKAEVDLSNARLNLIRAENAKRVAAVSLNNAMGVPDSPEYLLEDNLAFQKYPITVAEAVDKAYADRPDLKALLANKTAAEKALELAKRDYYPFLTGSAAYNWVGPTFPLRDGWSVGAALSFPIFSGFLTKKQVEEAKANLDAINANVESLRQSILLEVQQAFLSLTLAEESIANAELTVTLATENFEIANGRYAAGVGNPIEVTDAEVSLSNAKTGYIGALYDYRVARATIEKAIGLR